MNLLLSNSALSIANYHTVVSSLSYRTGDAFPLETVLSIEICSTASLFGLTSLNLIQVLDMMLHMINT